MKLVRHICREAEKNMRQARKLEILNFIDSLHEAHEEIKEALVRCELTSVQTMLAECQEFAVELGNAIEETEGEGCVTVSHVEKYCETLFCIFEEIFSSEDVSVLETPDITVNANRTYKILKKQLLKVENSVKNSIPIRREIAFFPYKASMWDSLESVYLAAKEDPNCDAYCVPIPYFDLNADHSFATMHYEGNDYPENIEITDWRMYNFEERRPDVIFIHNPYDELNHVTSVHPRYYTRNLKQYTDKLVYIPYFIMQERKPGDPDREEYIEKAEGFSFLPGTVYVDKVIVQSEDMRQIYINAYLKLAPKSNISATREELEEKILGLGSPKIDKVQSAVKESLEIPDEWISIVKKPDGSWKKIIFYNISVTTMLENTEQWINKIENVLEICKDKKEEVALLWRPHPLLESTMRSMCPQILNKYLEIKSNYLKGKWGIYDDTADLNKAISVSDAYYGDRSSVVELYRQTGKPIMIQNVDVLCT